jgi:SEC-C motif
VIAYTCAIALPREFARGVFALSGILPTRGASRLCELARRRYVSAALPENPRVGQRPNRDVFSRYAVARIVLSWKQMKLGRNESCPCGSGRKYKQCCLPRIEAKERDENIAVRSRYAGNPFVALGGVYEHTIDNVRSYHRRKKD